MYAYQNLIDYVLRFGSRKPNRTGVDTISVFTYNYEIVIDEGFPLLTTKEVSWKNVLIELLWFLRGDADLEFLHKHGVHFWDHWADRSGIVQCPYGVYWRRSWVDQIARVVDLLKRDPNTRRAVVSAWEPYHLTFTKGLVPCHMISVFNVQYDHNDPYLNLHLTQRSADIALGVPYNIASYALLQHLVSRFTVIPAGFFAHSIVDAHIYTSKPDGSMSEFNHVPRLKGADCTRTEISSDSRDLRVDPNTERSG